MPHFIGTAGWSLPRASSSSFPGTGSHLERYSQVLNCVEINSSFYREHSLATYRRWADSTPPKFKFAVKMPRAVTHDAQLRRTRGAVQRWLSQVRGLGRKLGPILIQLPPSMAFDARVARRFFSMLRELHPGAVVCEPRHATWFEPRAESALCEYSISRVAADPFKVAVAATPGGDTRRLVYYRLHGSPRAYWSSYSTERLLHWAREIQQRGDKTASWIVFDNTASGCATPNALEMRKLLD